MLNLTEVNLSSFPYKKSHLDIKTTPIPILEKKYFLSYNKPHPGNTDILIKLEIH